MRANNANHGLKCLIARFTPEINIGKGSMQADDKPMLRDVLPEEFI
ncbi:hypothetical protein EHW99_1412 [Erwinia amylovora]|uniref:Uncharacterized protein n=2 Tax=Erwinia amylovora TaxID=552 RepID=A0A831A3B6_ERWAM|nr:hypothetical protein EaACW_2187 [Erwinia amylovora ACW56400]QJQ54117.1 hypothetical protein EHX00_1412 [Erwinia amylovora]CBA21207.1 hypothetical protein predicted by Glimmer/Critica [Erwinia amylovora CFBP1430]CBJ46779.1 hypothetical protein EAM_2104 [Erwinia amylovora ATCC 49946]CCO79032.1 hypothetical protein BN432_2241 [Erwinia amylovora Ea356]CCO82836.1 hypothetical protein BN433_2272 [Erwinia amylovora Ea266]CCO86608.1 hypothetical protein BN434_2227 [Erwinia amylovora CFBP 2585]CCO